MNRTAIGILLLLTMSFSLWAFDAGGAVDSLSSLGGPFSNVGFNQTGRLTVWLGSELGDRSEVYLQGGATITTDDPLFLADLDLAYLTATIPVSDSASRLLDVTVGRSRFSDFSGELLRHPLDGVSLDFLLPSVTVRTAVGFTGLLVRENAVISLSKEDLSSTRLFGPNRVIGGVTLDVPELFARQNLTLAILVQEDLRGLFDDTLPQVGDTTFLAGRGGTLDTQYFGIGLDGAITPETYYDAYGYLNTGRTLSYVGGEYVDSPILAFMIGMKARYYLEDFYYTRISVDAVFASGDADFNAFTEGNTEDNATAFVPISQHQIGTVVSPQLSNIIKFRLAYSVKPLAGREDNFNAELGLAPYIRPTDAPVSVPGVLSAPLSTEKYLGTEVDLTANYRPFSDLYLSFATGLFIPNGDTFYAGFDGPSFTVSLAATLDF